MLSADSRFAFLLPRSRAGYSLPLPSTALILRSLELTPPRSFVWWLARLAAETSFFIPVNDLSPQLTDAPAHPAPHPQRYKALSEICISTSLGPGLFFQTPT